MEYYQIAIIVLIILVMIEIVVMNRILIKLIGTGLVTLDQNTAAAIKKALEELPDALKDQFVNDQDQPTYIQSLLGQWIQSQMNPSIRDAKVINRSNDGKFE